QRKKRCMFASWYPRFNSVTFSSCVIPLPRLFIDYLNSDHFAAETTQFPIYRTADNDEDEAVQDDDDDEEWSTEPGRSQQSSQFNPKYYQSYEVNDTDSQDESDEDCNERVIDPAALADITKRINDSIELLGGEVIPKLNWSAPKDATWMNSYGSLKCTTPSDVILLLKSSDFINNDLAQFELSKELKDQHITPYTLVLRKYHNLYLSMEFRCFVRGNKLVGISQRDTSTFYNFLPAKKMAIEQAIQEFFIENICRQFDDESYCFDVYITKENRVWLVDFNPIHPTTDSLLFDWYELYPKEDLVLASSTTSEEEEETVKQLERFEFRIVETHEGIKPNLSMQSRLPLDLASMSGTPAIDDMLIKLKDT
ncbi:hypothetical protein SAMD00019534_004690, partial [Acytostelium subglobosum LB1]|uniref:hypothetical protein n=1 Tax=Acytostelium subglobosum LB1 TaxID=1410327 RepID=UPI000644AAD8